MRPSLNMQMRHRSLQVFNATQMIHLQSEQGERRVNRQSQGDAAGAFTGVLLNWRGLTHSLTLLNHLQHLSFKLCQEIKFFTLSGKESENKSVFAVSLCKTSVICQSTPLSYPRNRPLLRCSLSSSQRKTDQQRQGSFSSQHQIFTADIKE